VERFGWGNGRVNGLAKPGPRNKNRSLSYYRVDRFSWRLEGGVETGLIDFCLFSDAFQLLTLYNIV
jgi:hypothetical protein